jgi:hypothetical protein
MAASNHDVMRRYLLGLDDPLSREELDRRLFSDDQVFWERLAIAEDDLIDDAAAGALAEEEADAFTSTFLCTAERRSKLEFAKAIREHARDRRASRPTSWDWLRAPAALPRWAVAVAALLVVVVGGVMWQLNPAGRAPETLAVALSPGLLRDAGVEIARVRPAAGCDVVHLDLAATGPYAEYAATVHDVDGAPLWAQFKLAGARRDGSLVLRLTMPCELLSEGDYWIRLRGLAPGQEPVTLDRYDFRVLRD